MKPVTKKTISEIAQISGVSKATVSRVINGAECVKPKTRDKVLEVIKQYGYVPSEIARGLSTQNSKVIGLVFPDLKNPFYFGLLTGITEVADQNGFNILMFYTDENAQKEKDILKVAKGRDLAGLILTAAGPDDPETAALLHSYEKEGIPVVLLDRTIQNEKFCAVLADNESGAYNAVMQFIKEGHKKIALVGGDAFLSPVAERFNGFKMAMRDGGIEILPEYIVHANQKSNLAYQGTEKLLDLPDPPTAIFAINNMTTLGVLRCLTERHIKIGKDISVIGFDDIEFLNIIDYKLSVVDRSEADMGRLAMKAMLLKLEGKDEEANSIKRVPTKLILRGTEKMEFK